MTGLRRLAPGLVHDAMRAASCVLQWGPRKRIAACVLVLSGMGAAPRAESPAPLAPAFRVAPLAGPLVLTDPYGELRGSHLHAGLDLRAAIGTAVRAPAAGGIERVRASGAGYGRSLYLRSDRGPLLVFGHLDAFSPSLAAYVDSAQRASGLYDQDLWPPAGRFRFGAGDTLAWSGESGAGPPHLHVEVRHGDFALNPLRAGFPLPDHEPPVIESLVLEGLGDRWRIGGAERPWLTRFAAARETVIVHGAVRASVRARDRVGGADAYAWSTAVEWEGEVTEARLDSISWAGEMAELDWMVDRGQARGARGLLLWAPAGWRPRLLRADAPLSEEAGTITVNAGDPPRPLVVKARDAAGHEVRRTLWLQGPPAGTPPPPPGPRAPAPEARAGAWLAAADGDPAARLSGEWLPEGAGYERVRAHVEAPARRLRAGDVVVSSPRVVALRRPLRLVFDVGESARLGGWGLEHQPFATGGGEWEGLDAVVGAGLLTAQVRRLGRFTLVRDTIAPVIGVPRVVHSPLRTPYSRWAVEVRVRDERSGVSARESELRIDGVRVPSEVDADAGVLRWRPAERPRAASLRVEVIATDRAGNTARRAARLVLDSATRR